MPRPYREDLAEILEKVAADGLAGPRDLDGALDTIFGLFGVVGENRPRPPAPPPFVRPPFDNWIDIRRDLADWSEEALAAQHAEHLRARPNDAVKVSCAGENFWVVVTEVLADGTYRGTVANDLGRVKDHGLDYGDEVQFSIEHIRSVNFSAGIVKA
jgi:hypothetical protein